MDIIEFAEKIVGLELFEYQKQFLRKMQNMPRDTQLLCGRRGFIVVAPRDKEKNTKPPQTQLLGLRAQTYMIDECDLGIISEKK